MRIPRNIHTAGAFPNYVPVRSATLGFLFRALNRRKSGLRVWGSFPGCLKIRSGGDQHLRFRPSLGLAIWSPL